MAPDGMVGDRYEVERERAADERSSGLAQLKRDPLMKSLVADPRYLALLKKIGLPL